MAQNEESPIPLEVAALGVAFAEALVQAQPDLLDHLKKAALKWSQEMEDRGEPWGFAADSLKALARALHDQTLFPKRTP